MADFEDRVSDEEKVGKGLVLHGGMAPLSPQRPREGSGREVVRRLTRSRCASLWPGFPSPPCGRAAEPDRAAAALVRGRRPGISGYQSNALLFGLFWCS